MSSVTFVAKASAGGWRQHRCVRCGSAFRCLQTGSGDAEAAEARLAEEQARKAAGAWVESKVDSHPCPSCGQLQPEMVLESQNTWLGGLLWLVGLGAVAMAILGIVVAAGGLGATWYATLGWGWLAFSALCAGLGLRLLGAPRRANADLAASLEEAQRRVAAGKVVLESTPRQPPHPPEGWPAARDALPSVLLLLAVAVAAGPQLARWLGPSNARQHPPFVGPGEQVTLFLPRTIEALKGRWSGTASALVTNAAELGISQSLAASASRDSWGQLMVGRGSSRSSSVDLWTVLTVPERPELAGKTLEVRVELSYAYPAKSGFLHFEDRADSLTEETRIRVGPPRAGLWYQVGWWAASALSGLLLLGAVKRSLRRGEALQKQLATSAFTADPSLTTVAVTAKKKG